MRKSTQKFLVATTRLQKKIYIAAQLIHIQNKTAVHGVQPNTMLSGTFREFYGTQT